MDKVLGFLKTFGVYLIAGFMAVTLWLGIFGDSGALAIIKKHNEFQEKQLELIGQQIEMINQQMSLTEAQITDLKNQQEAARQHIGTVAREEYHPAMKRIKEANAQEQLKEVDMYNRKLGLSQ